MVLEFFENLSYAIVFKDYRSRHKICQPTKNEPLKLVDLSFSKLNKMN